MQQEHRQASPGSGKPDLRRRLRLAPHLLLQLLPSLQALVSSQQAQLFQLPALHSAWEEEVQWERHVVCMPAARHIHIVLGFHPEGVDLGCTESTTHCYFSISLSQMAEAMLVSHQSRSELLLQQRDEGQAVGSLLGR